MKPVRFNKVRSKKIKSRKGIFIIEGFTSEIIYLRNVINKDIVKRISYRTFNLFYKSMKGENDD